MEPATGITRALARFVVASKPDDVPASAVHEAKRSLLHCIGCSIGGSRHESVQCALAAPDEFSGKREAGILGRAERVDAMLAALVLSKRLADLPMCWEKIRILPRLPRISVKRLRSSKILINLFRAASWCIPLSMAASRLPRRMTSWRKVLRGLFCV